MYASWVGLWAAGLLTRTQRLQLLACECTADAAVRELWTDTRRRPKKWTKFESADALIACAIEAYERLQHAQRSLSYDVRIVDASELGVQGRCPYLCIAGGFPPTEGALGIVGTRGISQHEEASLAQWMFPLVAQCHAVISGGAHGIDTIAHRVALQSNVPTWVVFASGLAHISPRTNLRLFEQCLEAGGGWISEKPLWYTPYPTDFLERNAVIAALSNAVLVARAPTRSGALSTARAARSLGRPVLAFPGNPDNENAEGCHQLLQGGALWAAPHTDLSGVLGTGEQLILAQMDEEATGPRTIEWPRVEWDEQEGEALRAFQRWKHAGKEGWIHNDATKHQEIVLDLELGGWVARDAAGQVRWTDRGRMAEKLLQSEAKDDV